MSKSQTNEKGANNKWGIGKLFSCLFKRFPVLLRANLLFAVPLAVSGLILWVIQITTGPLNIFFMLLPIIFCAPFYAGITQVTRDLLKDEKVKAVPAFIKGVKNNFRQFFVHGIILYLAILIDYFSIVFYYAAAQTNAMFYILFVFCLAVLLFLIFMFFYVPVISVTIELKLRYLYKNAALMALWELPTNLLALVGVAVLISIVTGIFMLTGNYIVSVIIAGVLMAAVLPAFISLIINFFVYPKVEKVLINGTAVCKAEIKDKEEQKKEPVSLEEELGQDPAAEEVLRKKAKGSEEYVFHNGRMIKRTLIEEYYQQDNGTEEEN